MSEPDYTIRNCPNEDEILPVGPSGPAAVQVTVTYREVGAGPETAEVTWENVVPLADYLVRTLKVMLDRGGES